MDNIPHETFEEGGVAPAQQTEVVQLPQIPQFGGQSPIQIVLPQPGRGPQGPRKQTQPKATVAKPTLARFFTSGQTEKIEVKWRSPEDSSMQGMGTYPAAAVGNRSIQEFLEKVIVPRYKRWGDFYVTYKAPGVEDREEVFSLLEPATPAAEERAGPVSNLANLLRDVIQMKSGQQQSGNSENAAAIAELRNLLGEKPPTDAVERMRLEAKIERLESQLNKPSGPDPLLIKLVERIDQLTSAPPSLPPGPPPVDPAQLVRETVREFADLMASRQPPQVPPPDPMALMSSMLTGFERLASALKPDTPAVPSGPSPEVVSLRESMARLQADADKNRDELAKTKEQGLLSALDAVRTELKEIKQRTEQPPASLSDQMQEIATVMTEARKFVGGVGGAGNESAAAYVRDIFREVPGILRQAATVVREVRDRDLAAAERTKVARDTLREREAKKQAAEQQKAESQPAAAQASVSANGAAAQQVEFIKTHIKALNDATSDGDMAKAFLASFRAVAKVDPRWKQPFDQTMVLIRNRDVKAIDFIDAALENFEREKAITPEKRLQIAGVFTNKFDAIATALFPPN